MNEFEYEKVWYDYESVYGFGLRLRVTKAQLMLMIVALTIVTVLAIPRVFGLIQIVSKSCNSRRRSSFEYEPLRPASYEFEETKTARATFEDSNSSSHAIINLFKLFHIYTRPSVSLLDDSDSQRQTRFRNFWKNRREIVRVIGYIILAVLPFVLVVTTILFAYPPLNAGNLVLPINRQCGLWDLDISRAYWDYQREGMVEPILRRRHKTQAYFENCWMAESYQRFTDPLCKTYAHGRIRFTERHGGNRFQNSPFSLDSGWQDAAVLGINFPKRFQFRRTLAATPLQREEHIDDTHMNSVKYSYGKIYQPCNDWYTCKSRFQLYSNYSAVLDLTRSNKLTYEYTVRSSMETIDRDLRWIPSSSVVSRGDRSDDAVSIIIVTGGTSIDYSRRQEDPIYPAQLDTPVNISSSDLSSDLSPRYYRQVPSGTVLAMVETLEIRDIKTGKKWNGFPPLEYSYWDDYSTEEMAAMLILYHALEWSFASSYYSENGGHALANRHLIDGQAIIIDDALWKEEMREAFKWMLAKAQIAAVDFVNGAYSEVPGATPTIPTYRRKTMCKRGLVKMGHPDFANINLTLLILYVSTLTLLFLTSFMFEGPGWNIVKMGNRFLKISIIKSWTLVRKASAKKTWVWMQLKLQKVMKTVCEEELTRLNGYGLARGARQSERSQESASVAL